MQQDQKCGTCKFFVPDYNDESIGERSKRGRCKCPLPSFIYREWNILEVLNDESNKVVQDEGEYCKCYLNIAIPIDNQD